MSTPVKATVDNNMLVVSLRNTVQIIADEVSFDLLKSEQFIALTYQIADGSTSKNRPSKCVPLFDSQTDAYYGWEVSIDDTEADFLNHAPDCEIIPVV